MLTIQIIFLTKKTLDKLSKLITISQLNHDYRNNKKTITRIFKSKCYRLHPPKEENDDVLKERKEENKLIYRVVALAVANWKLYCIFLNENYTYF